MHLIITKTKVRCMHGIIFLLLNDFSNAAILLIFPNNSFLYMTITFNIFRAETKRHNWGEEGIVLPYGFLL